MAEDAYQLQGLDGWEIVDSGQTFTGRSRGFQVLVAGSFDATTQSPLNIQSTFSGVPLTPGFYSGGIILTLTPSLSGTALVYPLDSNYTIV